MILFDDMPDIDDANATIIYSPIDATLYGYGEGVARWLKVAQSGAKASKVSLTTSRTVKGKTSRSLSATVSIVPIDFFIQYILYGSTTYAEALFAREGINRLPFSTGGIEKFMVSQSHLRNYASRARLLVDMCRSKSNSYVAGDASSRPTGELVAETRGCLASWEALMNTGEFPQARILCREMKEAEPVFSSMGIKRIEDKLEELEERMRKREFATLPYKLSNNEKAEIARSFGVSI